MLGMETVKRSLRGASTAPQPAAQLAPDRSVGLITQLLQQLVEQRNVPSVVPASVPGVHASFDQYMALLERRDRVDRQARLDFETQAGLNIIMKRM